MTQPAFIEVPAHSNILQCVASYIAANYITANYITANHSITSQLAKNNPDTGHLDTGNSRLNATEPLDLSNLFVLLPHDHAKLPFNIALSHTLNKDTPAFIPPWAGTLRDWVNQYPVTAITGNPAGESAEQQQKQPQEQQPQRQIINSFSRQLLFIEALQQQPSLFKEENQWQVSQALLALFDELSLNQQGFFNSAEALQDTLQQAYGIESPPQHLLNESKLVYTLWHAWQQQLEENALADETADHLLRLAHAAHQLDSRLQFICLGYSTYSVTEQAFIDELVENGQCRIFNFAELDFTEPDFTEPDFTEPELTAHEFTQLDHKARDHSGQIKTSETGNDEKLLMTRFISEAFCRSDTPIKQRARTFSAIFADSSNPDKNSPSAQPAPPLPALPLTFSTFLASNEEQQIRAIDLFVRLNILKGKSNIAIICEDRKLSRRLRALLERAGIPLQDKAGWSLATTQASTIIERWLECIEGDFNAYPLLDCLKSPFVDINNPGAASATATNIAAEAREAFKKNVYRFEHDLIFHENVSGNISHFKQRLKARLNRLSHWPANSYDELIQTLDFIELTAAPLVQLYRSGNSIYASEFLQALSESLQQLGVLKNYQDDDAGVMLLRTLESLKQGLLHANPKLSWQDCRTWLGMALESQHFTPQSERSGVQLMTLEQATHLQFDCIVIAACDATHFPGSASNSPFFNQAVRAALHLETWETQYQQRFELFKRTLLAAPEVLLTACNEDKGEEKPVSPWLELLINFTHLSFGIKPENMDLHRLIDDGVEVFNADDSTLPPEPSQPRPSLPQQCIPQRISASAYQRLINCPYQYFSADGLQLRALEELSDELKKADYGERIHFILQVFHSGHDKFGEAFTQMITAENRAEAENTLAKISDRVFHADLENNVLHRSWLHRWKKHIPAYIGWQMHHQSEWKIFQTEKRLESTTSDNNGNEFTLYGRLDRIDIGRHNGSHAIIDYKTGSTARQDDVDNGENVQLSVYSLLDVKASEVSYLSVDSSDQKVASKSSLSGSGLEANREQNRTRLLDIFEQMKNAKPLPAWGDDKVCSYCDFSGLCRKAEWQR